MAAASLGRESCEVELRIAAFVAHASIGPKTCNRLELGTAAGLVQEYQLQNSVDDGFIRLYSSLGHRYWIVQAQAGHRAPDWKLHVSVELRDLPRAWDIVAGLFIATGGLAAMKAINSTVEPPAFMRGRELTLYIYRHDRRYDGARYHDPIESERSCLLHRGLEQDGAHWLHFAAQIDAALRRAGVRSAGLARGDAHLPAFQGTPFQYCSYRNEAFVDIPPCIEQALADDERAFQASFRGPTRGRSYPPNLMGCNAARHADPFRPSSAGSRRFLLWSSVGAVVIAVLLQIIAVRQWPSNGLTST